MSTINNIENISHMNSNKKLSTTKSPHRGLRSNDSNRNAMSSTESVNYYDALGFSRSPTPIKKSMTKSTSLESVKDENENNQIKSVYADKKSKAKQEINKKSIGFDDNNKFFSPAQSVSTINNNSSDNILKTNAGRTPCQQDNDESFGSIPTFILNANNHNYDTSINSLACDENSTEITNDGDQDIGNPGRTPYKKTNDLNKCSADDTFLHEVQNHKYEASIISSADNSICNDQNVSKHLTFLPQTKTMKSNDDILSLYDNNLSSPIELANNHKLINDTIETFKLDNFIDDSPTSNKVNNSMVSQTPSQLTSPSMLTSSNKYQLNKSINSVTPVSNITEHVQMKSNSNTIDLLDDLVHFDVNNNPVEPADNYLSNDINDVNRDITNVVINRQNADNSSNQLDDSVMSQHHLSSSEYKYLQKKRYECITGQISKLQYIQAIDIMTRMIPTNEHWNQPNMNKTIRRNSKVVKSQLTSENVIKRELVKPIKLKNHNNDINGDVNEINELPDYIDISDSSSSYDKSSSGSIDEDEEDGYLSSEYDRGVLSTNTTVNNSTMTTNVVILDRNIDKSINNKIDMLLNNRNSDIRSKVRHCNSTAGVSFAKPDMFRNKHHESSRSNALVVNQNTTIDSGSYISSLDGCQEPAISKLYHTKHVGNECEFTYNQINTTATINKSITNNLNTYYNNNDFSMQYPSIHEVVNIPDNSLTYSIDSVDSEFNQQLSDLIYQCNKPSIATDSLSHIPIGRYNKMNPVDSMNSTIDTNDNYRKFDINVVDISNYRNYNKKSYSSLNNKSPYLPSRVYSNVSDTDSEQDISEYLSKQFDNKLDQTLESKLDSKSDCKVDISADNDTLSFATTSMLSEATTLTFDSTEKQTSSPMLLIKSKSRNKNDLTNSMKEISCVAKPGEYTTIQLKLSNKKNKIITMYPVVIQTRFDKTSSFDGILSDSKIDNELAFQVSPHKLRVHPNDDGIFYVTFSPMEGNEGIYTGAIKIRSKHKSFTILLRGEAYYSNEDRELQKQLYSQVNDLHQSITSTNVTTTPNPSTVNITPSTVDTVDIVNAVVNMNNMADEYIKRKYLNDDANLELLVDEKKQHLKEWISKTKSMKKGLSLYPDLLNNNVNNNDKMLNSNKSKTSKISDNSTISSFDKSIFSIDMPNNQISTSNSITNKENKYYFKSESYSFGVVSIGKVAYHTLQLCNNTNEEIKIFVEVQGLPFISYNHEIYIRERAYVRVPIRFVPTKPGDFQQTLFAKLTNGEYIASIKLKGSAYESI